MNPNPLLLLLLAPLIPGVAEGGKTLTLSDFEDSASLRLWGKPDHAQLVEKHATSGKQALKVTLSKSLASGSWSRLPGDWSRFDHLRIDFFNPGKLMKLALRFKDGSGKGYDLWNYEIPNGPHRAAFELKKIGAKMNLSDVRQFWFHESGKSSPPAVLYLDNVRLTAGTSMPPPPKPPSSRPERPVPVAVRGGGFVNLGVGGGGYMHSPSLSPHDPLLMQTSCDMGGRYLSSDGGKSWTMVPFWKIPGHSGRAAFDPGNVYLLGGNRVSSSPDKGKTWNVLPALPLEEKEKALLVRTLGTKSRILAVGTDRGLLLSSDRGTNWKRLSFGRIHDLDHLGDTLFVAAGKTLKASRDLGRSWSDLNFGIPENQAISLACGQDDKGMVLHALLDDKDTLVTTRDWGKNWVSNQVGGKPSRSASTLDMAANQTRILFVNRSEELWRSVDFGKSWERSIYARRGVAPGVENSEFCGRRKWGFGRINFAVDPVDSSRVMVTCMSDLFLSVDAGKTWQQSYNEDVGRIQPGSKDFFCRTRGLTMTSAWQYHVDPWDRKYQYVCYTDFGFIRSIDGGGSWAGSPPANSVYAMQFHPNSTRIFGAASSVHDIPGWGFTYDKFYKGGRVVYSDDRGDTWHTLGKGYPDIPCTFLELDRFRSKGNALVFWATFYGNKGGGLYRSDDSGLNWRQVKGLGYPHNDHFLEVRVHPKTGEIFVSVSGTRKEGTKDFKTGGFWYSKNDGRTWTDVAKSLDLRWQERFALVPSQPGTVYLATSTPPWHRQGGVYRTTDSGKTWKQVLDVSITKQVPYTSSGTLQVLSVDVHPTKPNVVYACTASHGLWCSQDGGDTWKFMEVPHFRVSHVKVDPANPELIYVTTFGGGTWRGYYLPG
tara:strand:- start:1221 stop:3857 length:2637 start_codon:yes stop_codon:yes gene_type:complete